MDFKEQYNFHNCRSTLEPLWDMATSSEKNQLSWSPQDLRDILDHFLSTPIAKELSAARIQSRNDTYNVPPALTFGELLLADNPEEAHLKQVKHYAKIAMQGAYELLPLEVANVVYISTISCAFAAGLYRFSRLERADVERSVRWCLAQGWVTPDIRQVLRRGISAIDPATI